MTDPKETGPSGEAIKARMQALSEQTADDIKACANECNAYSQKRLLVKVLNGQKWDSQLAGWLGKFEKRKVEFEFALNIHAARAVDSVKSTVETIDAKYVTPIRLLRATGIDEAAGSRPSSRCSANSNRPRRTSSSKRSTREAA